MSQNILNIENFENALHRTQSVLISFHVLLVAKFVLSKNVV